jgi:ABC-type branched-subunit amino acid transport system ATPase component
MAELLATQAALHHDGLSLLLLEQNATAALAIADRAVELETGRVLLQGRSAELRHEPELQAHASAIDTYSSVCTPVSPNPRAQIPAWEYPEA